MPIKSDGLEVLLDTSCAVAIMVGGHEHQEATESAIAGRNVGLAGHARFELFSVLTRLPPQLRRSPKVVADSITLNFPSSAFLSSEAAASLLTRLGMLEIAGGSVYDALVGATAVEHDLPLATRDRRALPTYRALGVRVELIG